MLDSVFSILGIDPFALQIPDTAILVVLALTFLFSIDWIFRIISMVIGTLTKRR